MKKTILATITVASIFMGWVNTVSAASFDCSKATTQTETAICNDPELSALDDLMAKAWMKRKEKILSLQPGDDNKDIRRIRNDLLRYNQNQKEWLVKRDQCVDLDCLNTEMRTRIVDLQLNQDLSKKSEILKGADEIEVPSMYNKVVDCWEDTQRTPNDCLDIFVKYVKKGTEITDFRFHDPMAFSFSIDNKKYDSTYEGDWQLADEIEHSEVLYLAWDEKKGIIIKNEQGKYLKLLSGSITGYNNRAMWEHPIEKASNELCWEVEGKLHSLFCKSYGLHLQELELERLVNNLDEAQRNNIKEIYNKLIEFALRGFVYTDKSIYWKSDFQWRKGVILRSMRNILEVSIQTKSYGD